PLAASGTPAGRAGAAFALPSPGTRSPGAGSPGARATRTDPALTLPRRADAFAGQAGIPGPAHAADPAVRLASCSSHRAGAGPAAPGTAGHGGGRGRAGGRDRGRHRPRVLRQVALARGPIRHNLTPFPIRTRLWQGGVSAVMKA